MSDFKRAVVALIIQNESILLGKKRTDAEDPLGGMWHIPGGKANLGESDETALKREMIEEFGVKIVVDRLLSESVQFRDGAEFRLGWFLCRMDGEDQEITPGDDVIEASFVPKEKAFSFCDPKASAAWPKEVREYLEEE